MLQGINAPVTWNFAPDPVVMMAAVEALRTLQP